MTTRLAWQGTIDGVPFNGEFRIDSENVEPQGNLQGRSFERLYPPLIPAQSQRCCDRVSRCTQEWCENPCSGCCCLTYGICISGSGLACVESGNGTLGCLGIVTMSAGAIFLLCGMCGGYRSNT